MQGCTKISHRENRERAFIHPRFSIPAQPCPPLPKTKDHLMTISARLAAALGASFLLFTTPVFAQSTAAPAKSDAAAPMAKTSKPRTAESLECSKQADAKGLHGKERKKFRSECKKAAMDKSKQ
jgi:psiF repeat-containing protein